MHRRDFLKSFAALSMAFPHLYDLWFPQGNAYAAEAARLTRGLVRQWWSPASGMFRTPVAGAETVSSDPAHNNGYTFWPSLLAFHSLIEGEKHSPGEYTHRIAQVYDGLEQYYNPGLHAYTAWVHFSGNIDAYYDDNSWVVIVLVEAYWACRKTDPARSKMYLERARAVMADYVVKGHDAVSGPGGIRWGTDPGKPNTADRGASSTAGSALAALMLARAGVEVSFHTQFGAGLLDWLHGHLLDADGLIMDALIPPNWTVRRIKWTYNTGVVMRACAEHYRLTRSAESLSRAERLARAAINLNGALFDRAVNDPRMRFYWDENYFVHYLIDGLLQAALVTHDPELAAELGNAIGRSTDYARTHLRDPADGFYWRNWRLYTIGTPQRDAWQKWTGQTISLAFDAAERSQEAQFLTLPVQDRPLVKTLLANAGAARLFWLSSRLPLTKHPMR